MKPELASFHDLIADPQFQDLVDTLATTRDFGGSQFDSFREWCRIHDVFPSEQLRFEAGQEVNRLYAEARQGSDHPTSA